MKRRQDAEGAVAVTTAILMVVLIMFGALVVDLGRMRVDRSDNQIVADSAAVAGVLALADDGVTPLDGCEAAWDYLVLNHPRVPLGTPSPCSGGSPVDFDGYVCDPSDDPLDPDSPTAALAETTVGDITVRIYMPVPADDPMMTVQTADADFDGTDPCERLAVTVTNSRDFLLAGVAGFLGGSTTVGAVGRTSSETQVKRVASLVVLDPDGCETAVVSSNAGAILVGEDSEGRPGIITVDSDGSDCATGPNDYVIRTNGDDARICAGLSNLIAAAAGAACDSAPETFFSPSVSGGRHVPPSDLDNVQPAVRDADPETRESIDHRYNCRATYSPTDAVDPATSAWHPGIYHPQIDGCDDTSPSRPTGDREHVDQIFEHFTGTSTANWVGNWLEPGCTGNFNGLDDLDGTRDDVATISAEVLGRNVFFNCSLAIPQNKTLNIDAEQYIVIAGSLTVNGTLNVNLDAAAPGDDDEDLLMVVNGQTAKEEAVVAGTQSVVRIYETAGLLRSGRVYSQASSFTWVAPDAVAYHETTLEPIDCSLATEGVQKVPSPECFDDLVVWGNDEGEHRINSGGLLIIEGIFFVPNSGAELDSNTNGGPFYMAGNSDQILDKAQFFAYRFDLFGNAKIGLTPDPSRNQPTTKYFTGLIR